MLARRPRMTSSTVLPERSPSASAIGHARVGRCPIRRPSSRSSARPPRRPADPPTSPARHRDHPTPRNRRSHYASAPAMPALGSCPERRLGPGHAHGGRRRPQPRDARTRTSLRETCKNCCVRGSPETVRSLGSPILNTTAWSGFQFYQSALVKSHVKLFPTKTALPVKIPKLEIAEKSSKTPDAHHAGRRPRCRLGVSQRHRQTPPKMLRPWHGSHGIHADWPLRGPR